MAVAVVQGRTRSLVERFEKRERFNSIEDQASTVSRVIPEADRTPTLLVKHFDSLKTFLDYCLWPFVNSGISAEFENSDFHSLGPY